MTRKCDRRIWLTLALVGVTEAILGYLLIFPLLNTFHYWFILGNFGFYGVPIILSVMGVLLTKRWWVVPLGISIAIVGGFMALIVGEVIQLLNGASDRLFFGFVYMGTMKLFKIHIGLAFVSSIVVKLLERFHYNGKMVT